MKKKGRKISKILLGLLPYLLLSWGLNRTIYAYRVAPGKELLDKLNGFLTKWVDALTVRWLPTFGAPELWGGIVLTVVIYYFIWDSKRNKKKFRTGKEYGSAVWPTSGWIGMSRTARDEGCTVCKRLSPCRSSGTLAQQERPAHRRFGERQDALCRETQPHADAQLVCRDRPEGERA